MPIYEYKCRKCGYTFDHLARSVSDTARTCPQCGEKNPVKQLSTFTATVGAGRSSCATGTCPTSACPTGTCSLG